METEDYEIEIFESPVGITFGHDAFHKTLIASKVNPARVAWRLGVKPKDRVLSINGSREFQRSDDALAHFRALCKQQDFPIILKFERLILSSDFSLPEIPQRSDPPSQPQPIQPYPPSLQPKSSPSQNQEVIWYCAQVLFGGKWFDAKVRTLDEESSYYLCTILFSDLASQHDVVGLSPTLPSARVSINPIQNIPELTKSTLMKVQKDPLGFLNDAAQGMSSLAGVMSSWWGNSESTVLQPEFQPAAETYTPSDSDEYPIARTAEVIQNLEDDEPTAKEEKENASKIIHENGLGKKPEESIYNVPSQITLQEREIMLEQLLDEMGDL